MQIKSIQPVYFSPTHTSAKIVTTIAEGMNIIVNKEIDLTPQIKKHCHQTRLQLLVCQPMREE